MVGTFDSEIGFFSELDVLTTLKVSPLSALQQHNPAEKIRFITHTVGAYE